MDELYRSKNATKIYLVGAQQTEDESRSDQV